MSEGRTAAGTARRRGSGPARLAGAWRVLPHESRMAALASLALFVTLFLPWYQVTLIAPAKTATLQSASATITGWGAFSFVEAAVLLVAAGVLTLLFQRAEGRAFHLPGGDGGVITAAGVWTCVLIVWRIFDKQGATAKGPSATSSGVEWGIFFALAAAAFLAYAGSRIRAAHRPEPPLPGEDRAPAGSSAAATAVMTPAARDRGAGQDQTPATRERPSRRARPPMPLRADSPVPADFPVPPDPPLWADPSVRAGAPERARSPASSPEATPSPEPASSPEPAASSPEPAPTRPRRRASAAELFERVVPDDPPTMPFGRARRADIHPAAPARDSPEPGPSPPPDSPDPGSASPPDEQLTIPFAGREDDTLPLAADHRSRPSEDPTLPLGQDATARLADDATARLGDDDTVPLDR